MPVIQINRLKKAYGKHIGVKDVTFSVEEGEIFGFVGPNGAGKSTTIRTLMGFIFPDSGSASIFGLDCSQQSKEIKTFTGYVPSDVRLYGDMRVSELLKRNGDFFGQSAQSESDRLYRLFDLDITKRFRELSTGNKKKVSVICALASKPKVVILDEPTSGLDPIMQKTLFEELKSLTADGVTVLLSSHNLAEVQEYCDRVAFIKDGSVIAVTKLKEAAEPSKLIEVMGGSNIIPEGWELLKEEQNRRLFRAVSDSRNIIEKLSLLSPEDFTVERESMEERFWDLFGKVEKS
ncbi:MAG: ABC transporter ATP-binding protein [Eubacteriales bacterium]|nr:ABC transporter ATP-binding protein [Eubacteriales bacterium]